MIRATLVLAALACASAFIAPPSTARSSMKMSAELLGADVETGGVFDPLGFTKNEASLYQYRAAELKHGRTAMLAVLHVVTTQYYTFPGWDFGNKPIAALSAILEKRPVAFWQIFLAIGLYELTIGKQDTVNKAPGDLGFGEDFKTADAEEFAATQLKELKNGRLAMLASMGEIVQELITGKGPVEQLLSFF